jgi:serine/threonine protein kinase
MSPEMLDGVSPQPAMDIYSLGVLLYEMVTGEVPFDGVLDEIVEGHFRRRPVPPSQRAGRSISPALESLILECLEKRPDDRPNSMAELSYRLRDLLSRFEAESSDGARSPAPVPSDQLAGELLQGCPWPVFRLDDQGVFQYLNPALYMMSGVSPSALMGCSLTRSPLQHVCPDLVALVGDLLKREPPRPVDQAITLDRGSTEETLRLRCVLVPILDDRRRLRGVHGYLQLVHSRDDR